MHTRRSKCGEVCSESSPSGDTIGFVSLLTNRASRRVGPAAEASGSPSEGGQASDYQGPRSPPEPAMHRDALEAPRARGWLRAGPPPAAPVIQPLPPTQQQQRSSQELATTSLGTLGRQAFVSAAASPAPRAATHPSAGHVREHGHLRTVWMVRVGLAHCRVHL